MSETSIPGMVGPYRTDRRIGGGGMGVVFLAHDTRLDRPVALKALPDEVAGDPDRLQRFEREAKTLASLDHPNIAGIYGIEQAEGRRYLALEYVEGESLAERLSRGPLEPAETADLCVQIAAAMEAAHESGIIHRDLKPGNVMITRMDQAKVVDFGLAKGRDGPEARAPALSTSPTLTRSAPPSPTVPGVILGTAPYLSPEQVRGKSVDRRADLWSFGCILYECLTAKRAFEGETRSDTIAKILQGEVDWSQLPEGTPPRMRDLLRRCLIKDPRQRLRDMGDARIALEELRTRGRDEAELPAKAGRPAARFIGLLPVLTGAVGVALGIALWSAWRPEGPGQLARPVSRLSIVVPKDLRLGRPELSPDGRALVAMGTPKTGPGGGASVPRLYVRRLDGASFQAIHGTERTTELYSVTADSRTVAFAAPVSESATELRVYSAPLDQSGPPVFLFPFDTRWSGRPAWLESGDALMPVGQGKEYVRFSLDGGTQSTPRRFDVPGIDGAFSFGQTLPHDRGALFDVDWYEGDAFRRGIGVLDLKSGQAKLLVRDASDPRYSRSGHVLFARGTTLLAVPFDLEALEIRGSPAGVLEGLRLIAGPSYELGTDGTLLYVPGGEVDRDRHAIVVDPNGRISDWSGERRPFGTWLRASPDGKRFASVITNPSLIDEIWISERGQPSSRRVVAVPGVDCESPIWSPDGRRLAYTQTARSDSDGIYVVDLTGSGKTRRVAASGKDAILLTTSWHPDGSRILVTLRRARRLSLGVLKLPIGEEGTGDVVLISGSAGQAAYGAFSPDGKLFSYMSDDTDRFETYVRAWSPDGPAGETVMVSTGGGVDARWGSDSRHLYFGKLPELNGAAAVISRTPRLSASQPKVIWESSPLRIAVPLVDVLPDGSLLAIQKGEDEDEIGRLDVILNFDEELRRRFSGTARQTHERKGVTQGEAPE